MCRLPVLLVVSLCSSYVYTFSTDPSTNPPVDVCEIVIPAEQVGNGGYIMSVPTSLPRASNGPGFAYHPGESYYGEEESQISESIC